jgi:ornithine carbamoyltransferase
MQTGLKGRDFIGDLDFSKEEVETVLDVAWDLKRSGPWASPTPPARQGAGDAVLLQQHPHARLVRGGHGPARRSRPVHREQDHADRHGDTAKEIGEILGRYNDGIAIRHVDWGVGNRYMRDFVAEASRVPVLNMQCDLYHPHQASPT